MVVRKPQPLTLMPCIVKGCKKMCMANRRWPLANRICHTHRQQRKRAKEALRVVTSGQCVRCGGNTRQKNDNGQWFHRSHTEHEEITRRAILAEQQALERMASDTTSLHERASYIDRMAKDAGFQTHGGESFYGPILTWRRQG